MGEDGTVKLLILRPVPQPARPLDKTESLTVEKSFFPHSIHPKTAHKAREEKESKKKNTQRIATTKITHLLTHTRTPKDGLMYNIKTCERNTDCCVANILLLPGALSLSHCVPMFHTIIRLVRSIKMPLTSVCMDPNSNLQLCI